MPDGPARVVVADANVLINLIHVGRLGLLGALQGYQFVVPEDVAAEITDTAQRADLEAALTGGQLQQTTITEQAELLRYAELRQIMGRGEAACLAIAEARGWLIASDEKRRLRREAELLLGPGRQITTPGLFVLAIRAGLITVEEADRAKDLLEQRRFRMAFRNFRDVIGRP